MNWKRSNSSGTAYTTLATIVQIFGEDESFEFMKGLHRNINQYTKSGSAPIKAAARGEKARQIRSNFRRRLAAFNHGAPACVGTLEAARCRIWLCSCRLIALSFDARGGDGVIWA